MLKIFITLYFVLIAQCFGHTPRLKFLLENPQNTDHDRGYFKGEFSIFSKKQNLLGFSNDDFEKLLKFQIQSVKPKESYRVNIERDGKKEAFLLSENSSGMWLKAILSSLVFNNSDRMMTMLGLEITDDFDQEILDYFKKYIEDFELQKSLEEEKGSPGEEINGTLTDISKTNEIPDNEKLELTLEDVLAKRFYKPNEILSFGSCDTGPCYKMNHNGVKIFFDRENLNIRFLELDAFVNEEVVRFSVKFDNYQKIGGRYNFPKNITFEGLNQKYLIKIDSFYLSKRLPDFKPSDLPELSLDQIFSI